MISEHVSEWLGLPVKLYDAAESEDGIDDYANTIYRLAAINDSLCQPINGILVA